MSAVCASPAPGVERRLDAVRALQHALYRAAKADPERRFHALYDKVHRRDVLQRAWSQVRRNDGAPGIDQITLAEVEEYGVSRLLDELEAELRARRSVRSRPGGYSYRSRGPRSGGRCRFPRSVTESCRLR